MDNILYQRVISRSNSEIGYLEIAVTSEVNAFIVWRIFGDGERAPLGIFEVWEREAAIEQAVMFTHLTAEEVFSISLETIVKGRETESEGEE